ncbi:MAG: hypothetical protein LBI18_04295 [Planctomycetaceae bacterium]|jgi:hypothetical protein|nr:hypothetical protein [Planctomycetaceae bacterium]
MPRPTQTNKEFVDAAGIAEQDAFIAVAIRRIVAKMTEIPAQELLANMTFEKVMKRQSGYDWDSLVFAMEIEELFNFDISCDMWDQGDKLAKEAGYSNWFYNPDNDKQFSFLWKPFYPKTDEKKILFGEWVKLIIEIVLAPIREKFIPPNDWPGLEASDLDSDTVAQNSLSYSTMFCIFCAIMILVFVLWFLAFR